MGKKERILTIFLSLMLIFIVGCSTEKNAQADENESLICKAKVLSVKVSEVSYPDSDDVYTEQILKVQPVEGPYKGQVFETEVSLGTPNNQNISPYRKGDTVELEIYPDETAVSVDLKMEDSCFIGVVTYCLHKRNFGPSQPYVIFYHSGYRLQSFAFS